MKLGNAATAICYSIAMVVMDTKISNLADRATVIRPYCRSR